MAPISASPLSPIFAFWSSDQGSALHNSKPEVLRAVAYFWAGLSGRPATECKSILTTAECDIRWLGCIASRTVVCTERFGCHRVEARRRKAMITDVSRLARFTHPDEP